MYVMVKCEAQRPRSSSGGVELDNN